MTATPATAGRICRNVSHIAGLGFTRISLAFDLTSPGWDRAALEKAACSLDELSDWYVAQVASGAPVTIPAFDSLAAGRSVPPCGLFCGAACTLFSVDPDGAIHPCWRFAGDPEWRMGDVFSGFQADPAGHVFNRIKQRETTRCRDCAHTGYCGRCAWLGLRLAGDPAAVSALQCRVALMVIGAGRKACDALISSGSRAFIARLPVLDAVRGGDGTMVLTDRPGSVYNIPASELERFRVR
jgi:radical SAM protein with 4Fe4S-binding SPASM domain